MSSVEFTPNKPANKGGVYRHPETGTEVIAMETEKFGSPQADAYVRLGFEYVGPVEEVGTKEDKEALDAIVDPGATPAVQPLGGQLEKLEAENARLNERLAALEAAASDAAVKKVDKAEEKEAKAKVAAAKKAESKDEAKTETVKVPAQELEVKGGK